MVSHKVGETSKTNLSQPVSASSDVVQTTAISDRPKIKAKFKKKPIQPTAGSSNINDPSQATLDANYARGVMAGVAAMKPQYKAEVSVIIFLNLCLSKKLRKFIHFTFLLKF